MAKTKAEKIRESKRGLSKKSSKPGVNNNIIIKDKKRKKKKQQQPPPPPQPPHDDPAYSSSDDDDDSTVSSPERLHRLIEPHTKDQLISLLVDAAAADPALLSRIKETADADVSQRKLFVHGLGWDATRDQLLSAFLPLGPVDDCNVVTDKATGRSKGYGFVLFSTRAAARKALKAPQRRIGNRITSCQLASLGPAPAGDQLAARRIYVSNVPAKAAPEKLRALFATFGELEAWPTGVSDPLTGKPRGFAVFVYKTAEGARRCLEEPQKMFEGRQLHCQLATDPTQPRGKTAVLPVGAGPVSGVPPFLGAAPQPVLAAAAAAQTYALLGQNPAVYSVLFGQNPLLAAAVLNPNLSALNPTTAGLAQAYGGSMGLGSGGVPSLLGAFGAQGDAGLQALQSYQGSHIGQAPPSAGLQGLQSYQGSHIGQASATAAAAAMRPGGALREFPSYLR